MQGLGNTGISLIIRIKKHKYMKHNYCLIATAAFAAVMLASCKSSDSVGANDDDVRYMLPQAKTMQLTTAQQKLVSDNNTFAFNLFNKIVDKQNNGKSVFMSPMSVTFMLGMVQSGANAATQQQTATAMGFAGQDSQTINEWCNAIMTQAPEIDKQVTLLNANAIYVNNLLGFELQDAYKADMEKYYDAGVSSLDFSSPKAVKTINKWCSDHTKGMLKDVLDETKADATAYLLNSVYFEAKWTKQFDKANTKDETFTAEDGTMVTVPMMHNQALVRAYVGDDFTLVCLPYGSGDAWNMLVVLPAEGKTVADVAKLMKDRLLKSWTYASKYQLDIKIPKFSLKTHCDLKETLPQLGITNIFNSDDAGLTGIGKTASGDASIYISKMFQDAAIDVAEEGTKATAVTVAETMFTTSLQPQQTIEKGEFHADRPFLYFITEANSDAIFFAGTYTGK